MSWRAVWQRLKRLRTPLRGQTVSPLARPAAAPDEGKQRRGYSDKAIHPDDYEDKEHPLDPPGGVWQVYVDGERVR